MVGSEAAGESDLRRFHRGDVLSLALIALAYFLAHKLAFFFPDAAMALMAIWPAGGVGLAALLLCRQRLWTAILVTLFVTGASADLLAGRPPVSSLGFVTANVFQSFSCAWIIARWRGQDIRFARIKDVSALIFAATVVNAATACLGAGAAALTHAASFASFWLSWWIAGGLGILLVAPAIVTLFRAKGAWWRLGASRTVEWVLLAAVWGVVAWMTFEPRFVRVPLHPYMLVVILAWPALRFGQRTVSLALIGLAVIAILSAAVPEGPGPWGGTTAVSRLLDIQVFLGFTGVVGVMLGASFTETRSLLDSLHESERKYRNLFNNAEIGMFRTRADGSEILDFNDKYLEIFGRTREEMVGNPTVNHWADPAERASMMEKLKVEGRVTDFECRMIEKGGAVKRCLTSLRLYPKQGILEGSIIDITDFKCAEEERLKLEQQVAQSQRLESLGLLAGGIAHDFNNLMAGIYDHVELALDGLLDKEAADNLARAMSSMGRARDLTRQLLTFAKGGAPVRSVGRLFPFAEESARFALSGGRATCTFDIPADLWPCNFDRNQIGQVVDNLVINARQATPGEGSIRISARNARLEAGEAAALPAGDYVIVSIADSGIGIPPEVLPRIFDPFFTTKEQGRGLGLSTCHSIMRRHDGAITVESTPGKGSTFHLYLPAARAAGDVRPAERPAAKHRGRGRVLVMDDEKAVSDVLASMLTSLGHAVETVGDGGVAVELFAKEREAGRPFRAAFLDLTVPGGMGGGEAARRLRAIDKVVPLFVMSGYAEDPVMADPAAHGFSGSLRKPFAKADLSDLIDRHLASDPRVHS